LARRDIQSRQNPSFYTVEPVVDQRRATRW
jgi:hypothetical protein